VGLIAKNGILIVESQIPCKSGGCRRRRRCARPPDAITPGLDDLGGTVFGHLPLVLVSGPGAAARNSIGMVLVTGMTVGTIFTLFVVRCFTR
jgi:multidrug efflux pump